MLKCKIYLHVTIPSWYEVFLKIQIPSLELICSIADIGQSILNGILDNTYGHPNINFLEMGSISSKFVKQQMCTSFTEGFFFDNTKTGKWEGMDLEGYDVVIYIYIYIYKHLSKYINFNSNDNDSFELVLVG